MDALKITDQARSILERHEDGAETYVQHHLDAAEDVGLEGAARDWRAVLEALHHLRGEA